MNSLAKPAAWEKFFWPLLTAGLLLAVWHYSVIWTATKVFPSPLTVEKGLAQLLHRHVLWADIGDSLRRVAIGFGLAAVIGIPLGLALGWYPALNQVVNPVIQILRPISPIAWIPVAIVFFGVGERPAVFLIFLSAFFPILVACASGVSNVPAIYRRAGRNFGLTPCANPRQSRLSRRPSADSDRFAPGPGSRMVGSGRRGDDRGRFWSGFSGH